MDIRAIVTRTLGPVIYLEDEIPGVYYVSLRYIRTGMMREYYIIETDAAMISEAAKTYGKPLRHHPELLSVLIGPKGNGYLVIRFEIALQKVWQNLPPSSDESIADVAMYGMIDNPEFFGEYPAPLRSPDGKIVRYERLKPGVFDVLSERGKRMIAVAEPVWRAELSDQIVSNGVQLGGYLFISSGGIDFVLQDLQ